MLNPLREMVANRAARASGLPSPFRAEVDAVLVSFREARREIEARVGRGDLTPKVAREQAAALAAGVGRALRERAGAFSPTPRLFLDRLTEAAEAKRLAAERTSLEGLQRETNRLLRSVLVEQQIQARAGEFEGRSYSRAVSGGSPAPTLDGLLAFHESSTLAGDDAAAEWARRGLEAFRSRTTGDDDRRRIDRATDRPDRVNPRLVSDYIEAMEGRAPEALESFVAEAVATRDANACMAAFVLARQAPEGGRLRWVRQVLDALNDFPVAALAALRALEVEARDADRDAATAQAEDATARAEAEARLDGLEAPSPADLARRSAMEGIPVARPGEAIGLALSRRGLFDGEAIGAIDDTPGTIDGDARP